MQTLAYIGPAQTESEIIYSLINSKGPVAVDVETVSLKNQTPIGVGLQWSDVDRAYFGVFPTPSRYLDVVYGILGDSGRTKIYHNGKSFDLIVLSGVCVVDDINVHDTYYMAKSLGIEANLDFIGKNLFGFQDMFTIPELLQETAEDLEVKVNKVTMLDVPFSYTARKCMNDVRATWFAYQKLPELMNAQMLECYEVDRKLIHVLREMEKKGLQLDKEILASKFEHYTQLVDKYLLEATELGFNPGSPQQVAMHLAHKGHMLKLNRSGKSLSTDEEALEGINDPDARLVLAYRKAKKLLSTYLVPYMDKDRAYSTFRGDLSTGRLASANTNLQNIPPDMRDIFSPDNVEFTWLDYSQIEMRLFAYMSGDKRMLEAYANGEDIHYVTQSELWPGSSRDDDSRRLVAKTFNFALIYLAKAGTLAAHTKLPYHTARQYRDAWLNLYPQGHEFMIEQTRKKEPWATTLFGRRMRLPDGPTEDHIQKCRINYPIQGTAADIIKRAMLIVSGVHGLDVRVQVHDELVFDGSVSDVVFTELGLDSILGDYKIPYNVKRGPKWI